MSAPSVDARPSRNAEGDGDGLDGTGGERGGSEADGLVDVEREFHVGEAKAPSDC